MSDRDAALEVFASMDHTSRWLNQLDRLFALIRDSAVALTERAPGETADDLLAAIDGFRMEFYGALDGSDDPDAAATPDEPEPATIADIEAKLTALLAGGVSHIPEHGVAAIVLAYEASDAMDNVVSSVAKQLREQYPEPKPLVILRPNDSTFEISTLDEDTMLKSGWVRK